MADREEAQALNDFNDLERTTPLTAILDSLTVSRQMANPETPVSNQTPEWRAVTAELSGYRVAQAPYLNALSSADIIGIAQAILRVHPPVLSDSSMQAMARSAEFRALEAEAVSADLLAALVEAKKALWVGARGQWNLSDFKNWAVIQQIDAALTKADGVER